MTDFRFVKKPNLPENKVCHTVVSPQYPQVINALKELNISPLTVTSCNSVLFPLRNHADMLFSYLGNGVFAVEQSQNVLTNNLINLGYKCSFNDLKLKADYPYDIPFNCCVVGNHIICKSDYTPELILHGRTVINVKQGYAKCSCIPVDENSIITDDLSIFDSAIKAGIDALLVEKGNVHLEGFDTGFIGGCCGKISKDILAFCGDIKQHSDYNRITSFLRERQVYAYSLFGGKLIDIGSIIPISQY